MTKATVCLATAFSAVCAIGCSSSSSNNDGGAPKGDSALPVFADAAGNPLAAPVGGACPGLPCTMPQKCCLNPLSMTGVCQDPTAMCGGILTGCASPSECMDPQVCCGSAGRGGGPAGFSIACTDPAQCVAQDGGGFVFRLCDSTHACPTGQTCMAPPGRGGGGGMGMFCFSPGMFGMMRPDAGAAEAGPSEAGPSEAGPSEAGPSDAGGG